VTAKPEIPCAVTVDDNGKLQSYHYGPGGAAEAKEHRDARIRGGVDVMRHSTIVTGKLAREAMQNGRI